MRPAFRSVLFLNLFGFSSILIQVFGAARGGDLQVVGDVADVATLPDCFFGATLLPMLMYLRIFYMRFGPMPLIARKSSTLLKAPYDLRIFRICPRSKGRFQELAAAKTP